MLVCPFCGHENPDTTPICVLCLRSLRYHRARWKRWGVVGILAFLLVITIFAIEYFSRQAELPHNKPVLEILASAGYRTRFSGMIVEGKVRNVSTGRLSGVYVVASWYSKDKQLLGRQKVKLPLDPLLSYQISSFVVKLPHKPGMEHYDLSFETEDGSVLYAADTRLQREIQGLPPGGQ